MKRADGNAMILRVVRAYIGEQGTPPTVAQLADACKMLE
jgi:hypothetical protein